MDTPREEKKVHDIYPDDSADSDSNAQHPDGLVRMSSTNHARRRPSHVPRVVSQSYPAFKAKQDCALRIGIKGMEEEVAKGTGIGFIEMLKGKLTVHFRSQSKLSQQELSDLQKATHFDKKELQQWYKGKRSTPSSPTTQLRQLTRNPFQASLRTVPPACSPKPSSRRSTSSSFLSATLRALPTTSSTSSMRTRAAASTSKSSFAR